MKLNLVESAKDRESVMSGNLGNDRQIKSLLSGLVKADKVIDYMDEQMVADFYMTTKKSIEHIGTRNKKELEKYGYKVYTNAEIKQLQQITQLGCFKIPPRGKRLYPLRAVFLIGMMLTESEVAERLREEIISLVFDNRVDLIEVRQDRLEQQICIKKKQSSNIVKAIQRHLGIGKIADAPEQYHMLSMLILAYFGVTKFEDIPVTTMAIVNLKECFDIFDNKMYKDRDKQIEFKI